MNRRFSTKVMRMLMSGTKRHRRRQRTKNACGRRTQFKTTIKGRPGAQLTTFSASAIEEFGINKSVISHAWKAFQTVGTAVGKIGGGHHRKNIAVNDRYIFLQSSGPSFVQVTIRKETQWSWSCRLGRQYAELSPIFDRGWTEPYIFDRGSVSGDRYCKEVTLPHVCLFRDAIGTDFAFMVDNARPHRSSDVQLLLESEDAIRMDWSAFFYRTCVGCFRETPCGMIIPSREHLIVEIIYNNIYIYSRRVF
ncbi:transposable element Tcb2 transposase [Trichonephila clavipes]|nr:transposable element Tcb2 transposase [Trichonephila clavipes]